MRCCFGISLAQASNTLTGRRTVHFDTSSMVLLGLAQRVHVRGATGVGVMALEDVLAPLLLQPCLGLGERVDASVPASPRNALKASASSRTARKPRPLMRMHLRSISSKAASSKDAGESLVGLPMDFNCSSMCAKRASMEARPPYLALGEVVDALPRSKLSFL